MKYIGSAWCPNCRQAGFATHLFIIASGRLLLNFANGDAVPKVHNKYKVGKFV